MKSQSKQQKERQKQKIDFIFRYMKSLTPFQSKDDEAYLQSQMELKAMYDNLARQKKESIMTLSSRVYQLKFGSPSKKRVKFLDDLSDRQKIVQGYGSKEMLREDQNLNPQKIKRDLVDIQRSVFQLFKNKEDDWMEYQNHSPLKDVKMVDSLMLSSRSRSAARESEMPVMKKPSLNTSAFKISRSISQLLLSSKMRASGNQKDSQKCSKKNLQSFGSKYQNNSVERKSTFLSNFSQNLGKRMSSSNKIVNSSLSARSQSFWKQQNNLMVEIFKNKLNLKLKK